MEQVYNHTQNKPSSHATGLTAKAPDIKNKAQALSSTADGQSTNEITNIRNNDIQGNNTKGSGLKDKAAELKSAASNLHDAAQSLESAAKPTSPLAPLNTQATQLKEAAKKDNGKEGLYYKAEALAGKAGNTGLEALANAVIAKFELVKTAYDALMEEAKRIQQETNPQVTDVENAYKALKGIYDQMLNLTKLAKKAKELNAAATQAQDLQQPAGDLESNVKALRDAPESGQDYVKAQTVITQFETVQYEYNQLNDQKKQDVKDKFEALNAGTDSSQGLRGKALALHTQAELLHNAVIAVSKEDAARVLKFKAGTSDEEEGKLRKLAADLYTKADELQKKVGVGDSSAAQNLATEVGENESAEGLRKKLRELHEDPGPTLTNKAQAVTTQYSSVSLAFGQVQLKQTTAYTKDKQAKYQAVEAAMTAFDKVYNPEEQLKDAVNSLQEALTALAEANILNMYSRAEVVKEKFEGFGTVKSKFDLVQKQVDAYGAGGIKASHYDPLVEAWAKFNNAYREVIYPTKFYWIVITSIFSMLSDWSQKTQVLLYEGDKQYKFGGWELYKANKFGSSGPEPGDHVYGWIWHFFDIFIYCLHYRE